MSNKKWECEIIAPPELHKPIQELFDAISWKLKHAESSSAQIATDINVGCTIYRQSAIDVLDVGKELLSCALDNMDIVGNDREKFEWGLDLIESYIEDIKDIPPAQPEEVIPHRNYKYLSDYWCECGWHLGKKGEVKYCSECGRKVNWGE